MKNRHKKNKPEFFNQGNDDFVLSAEQNAWAEEHRLMLGAMPTPQQVELYHYDPYHYVWAEDFFSILPKRGAEYFRTLYVRQFKRHLRRGNSGYVASREARQYTADVLMPRIERVLAQYSHIVAITDPFHTQFYLDTLTRPEGENGFIRSHRKPLYLYTKHEIDKLFAIPLSSFFEYLIADFGEQYRGKVEDTDEQMLFFFKKLYRKIGQYCADLLLPLPNWAKLALGKITLNQIQSDITKACCTEYWNKRLNKAKIHMAEHIAIAAGQVNKQVSAYVSREAMYRYQEQRRKNFDWLKDQILINIDDPEEQAELVKTYVRSSANPDIRRMELMNKLRGVEEYAEKQGHIALFLTLTAPSSFHAYHSKGGFNAKWQGQSPKQTQKYLCGQWAKMRAAWARLAIEYYGMRVVEPHHDATPHWHILVFLRPQSADKFCQVFKQYALEVDADEQGAKKHRCKIEFCDPKKGSATGYITKYISKNINGYALDGEMSDETNESLKTTAYRASAWASLWRIRQFQDFGVPPISVWRELRRLGNKQILDDEEMEALRVECDEGRFAGYITLQGGTDKKRVELLARLSYDKSETNAYLETRTKIEGVYNQLKQHSEAEQSECERKIIKTRLKRWAVIRKPVDWDEQETGERSEAAKESERSSPWTCVNNCTPLKIGHPTEFLTQHASEAEIIRLYLQARQVHSRWITDHRIGRLIIGEKVKLYGGLVMYWNGRNIEFEEIGDIGQ